MSGFVVCSQQTFVTISGQLKQTRGGVPISGFFSVLVPCTGTTPWSVTVQTVPALFHGRSSALFTGGKADVTATATAFDPDTGEFVQRDLAVTVTLRGKTRSAPHAGIPGGMAEFAKSVVPSGEFSINHSHNLNKLSLCAEPSFFASAEKLSVPERV